MKQMIFLMLFAMSTLQLAVAQDIIKLWPNGAPGNNECPQPEETFQGKMVRFVSEPTLTIYLPDKEKNTGVAVVICPGGGYWIEAMEHEGYACLLYTSPSPRDGLLSRMPSSA